MPNKSNVMAVILGGGAGTRLFPLTQDRAKPAVPLAGKYRLIDVPVSNCINSGVTSIYVLTQFNSASLNRHISGTFRFSSFSEGFVEILAAEQRADSPQWFQGTADAVRQIFPHLRDSGIETVLILSGDHLYRMNYAEFLDKHYETNADVTISVIPSTPTEASSFGLLKTDDLGKIIEFKEKPEGDELKAMRVDTTKFGLERAQAEEKPYLASMGIYVFSYQGLVNLLEGYPDRIDFGREVIPAAINELNVQSYLFNGYWEDIGTIRSFYQANLDLTSPVPKFNFFNAVSPIYTRSRYLPPSKVHDSEIGDSLISEGCILNGIVSRNSIIGLRSRIDVGAQIYDSIIMGNDFYETLDEITKSDESGSPHLGIGEGTVIRNAITDKNVRIGKNCRLTNESGVKEADGANYYIRDGIILVPKNAVVYDGTVI
ncbi:MAG: glucose-1-phosphate adenylyltransferase [Pyrinomonadaceae bacterium]